MHKKFGINWTKIKNGCRLERKAAEMISYSKIPLEAKGKTMTCQVSTTTYLATGRDQKQSVHNHPTELDKVKT